MTRSVTSVAHIGSRLDSSALFLLKTRADPVAFMAGPALGIADDELATGIGLFTAEPLGAEVLRIVEETFSGMILGKSVLLDFFGDGGGVFAQVTSDVFKRRSRVKAVFNVKTVFDCKVFVVSWNVFAHDRILSLLTES